MKKNVIWIGLGVLGVIGGGIALAMRKPQDSKEDEYMPTHKPFPLRKGSHNPYVKQLQLWLIENYHAPLLMNGVFDKYTEKALLKHTGKRQVSKTNFYKYKMDYL